MNVLPAGSDIIEYVAARKSLLSSVDPRVVPYEEDRTFTNVLETMPSEAHPRTRGPVIMGPPTAPWYVMTAGTQGIGSFLLRHQRWVSTSGVGVRDRVVHEHEFISRLMDHMVSADHLNVRILVAAEFALRRLQLHEGAVGEDPCNPSYEAAAHDTGSGERRGGALTATSLKAWVATEFGREAAIMKEKRNARENTCKT